MPAKMSGVFTGSWTRQDADSVQTCLFPEPSELRNDRSRKALGNNQYALSTTNHTCSFIRRLSDAANLTEPSKTNSRLLAFREYQSAKPIALTAHI